MRGKFFIIFRKVSLSVIIALLIFIPFREVAAQSCVQPPSGLVGWWPGDGDANDIVSGNHGVLINGLTFAIGMVDEAFSFDGVDDVVKIQAAIIDVRDPYTIDAWILLTQEPTTPYYNVSIVNKDARLFSGETFPNGVDLGFFITKYGNGGVPRQLGLCHVGGTCAVFSTGQIPLNELTHVAVTYDGVSTAKFYINGQLDSTHAVVDGANNQNVWTIGRGGEVNPDTTEAFNGLIDEVEIFNRALTDIEIQAIFNAGSAGKCKHAPTVFSCVGFDPPLENSPVTVKKNRVLPLKAVLLDSNNTKVTNTSLMASPVLQVFFNSGSGPAIDVTNQALPAGQGTEGNKSLSVMKSGDSISQPKTTLRPVPTLSP